MLKTLRIAVTALSVTACLLLIAFWVRSNRWHDSVGGPIIGRHIFQLDSIRGRVRVAWGYPQNRINSFHLDSSDMRWLKRPVTSLRPTWKYGFGKFPNYTSLYLNLPHWLPIFLTAIFATLPWIRPCKRFSLRTLLVATTLVAVGLGLVVYLSG
jgi:hypothetical protein